MSNFRLTRTQVKSGQGGPYGPRNQFLAVSAKNAEYPDAAVVDFTCLSSDLCLKKITPVCVWVPVDTPSPNHQLGGHSTEIIFHIHVTFDLSWLYIDLDIWYYHTSILSKIRPDVLLIIYLLKCNFYPYAICMLPSTIDWRKYAVGKVVGKILKWIRTPNFFVWNVFIYLFLTPNNHQAKVLLHQDRENAKSIWSFVSLKWRDMKNYVLPLFFKPNFIFLPLVEIR